MESIAVALQPYKDTVGLTAAIVTVIQFFGGVLAISEIRRRGSTAGFSVLPFLGGTAFCLLNVQFGQMLRDDGMIRVNFIGLVLHLIYVCAFYLYTEGPRKTAVWGQIGLAGALTVGVLSYVQYEDPKLVQFRFGVILTALLWTLVGMPLLGLGEILKKKSTAGLPFPMILLGSIVSFLWLLYGIILRSNFLVVQNLVALALCAIQLSLFIIFPAESVKPPPSPAKKRN
uniref:Sugar transporter SWEET n=1 Tax=Anopheles triannulatus TaxID=58253 RepID=A0A2M4AG31_9DIPT